MSNKSIVASVLVIFGLFSIGFVSIKAWEEVKRNQKIKEEIEAIRLEGNKIRRNNEELENRIAYFQTSEFQEKAAKDKLNFQKNDEEVVIIKSSPSIKNIQNQEKGEILVNRREEEEVPNYQKWWHYFFR